VLHDVEGYTTRSGAARHLDGTSKAASRADAAAAFEERALKDTMVLTFSDRLSDYLDGEDPQPSAPPSRRTRGVPRDDAWRCARW
jgi:hypothetical protein